jgi:peptidylprolyl isomerase domain and WD repeat-containing protein 1
MASRDQQSKRALQGADDSDSDSDSSSDDDFGPMPSSAPSSSSGAEGESSAAGEPGYIDGAADTTGAMTGGKSGSSVKAAKKKPRKLAFEQLFIDNLPSSEFYERSFMHRDLVTHIVVSKPTEFVITGSVDGHVKFWKKMPDNVEFVKHYQAHLGNYMKERNVL